VTYDKIDYTKIEYDTIRTNKKKTYINLECGFDIETTSTYMQDEKVAFMYEWTFGIKDKNFICYGRTWEQFIELCEKLQRHFGLGEDVILVVYIHNFSFEFQFMRKYFEWLNVFSIDERKPIKALCSYGIEFRDSYILSGYSLQKTAENLQSHKIEKLVGELDYSLIRTSDTELSEVELQYCENDVLIILYYINEQIKQYGDITKIPLTNTSRVRNYVRNNCYHSSTNHRKESKRKYYKYREIMGDLQLTKEEYVILKRAFQGGFTHANPNYSGKLLKDVTSIDFTSSYPSVMLSEKFPMSRGMYTSHEDLKRMFEWSDKPLDELCKRFCVVFDVVFEGLQSKISYENYISESKCQTLENSIINNGRVYSADKLITTITDIDYNIIKNCYTWEKMGVRNIYRYCKGYLPKDIILSILKLYEDKTTLKGVEDKEVEYLLSKGMLNSVYGMCVTDIVRDEITYTDEWGSTGANIDEQIETYNKSYNRFLYYPWGVWVTAYSRRNLWLGIKNIADDYVYSDTDSIKFLNYEKHKEFISWYDNIITEKLNEMCDYYRIDKSKLKPKTIKGSEKMIGVWDLEGTYSRFKTLGAKRYLVEHDGKLQLTVAGLSKQNGINYMIEQCDHDNTKVFNMFNDDLYIPKEHTGKMTHSYVDIEHDFMIQDYQGNESHVITKSGVHLESCEFTLSISKQYANFLKMLMEGYIFKGVKEVG
jgi:hypothetical protein